MRGRFDTLFGRLFGMLFVAIVLAHLLAFACFTTTARHRRPRRNLPRGSTANIRRRIRVSPIARHVRGSAGRWCR